MPFDGRKRRNLTAIVAAVMCTVLLLLSYFPNEPLRKDAAIETIVACFASKGERVSADAVRDWIA